MVTSIQRSGLDRLVVEDSYFRSFGRGIQFEAVAEPIAARAVPDILGIRHFRLGRNGQRDILEHVERDAPRVAPRSVGQSGPDSKLVCPHGELRCVDIEVDVRDRRIQRTAIHRQNHPVSLTGIGIDEVFRPDDGRLDVLHAVGVLKNDVLRGDRLQSRVIVHVGRAPCRCRRVGVSDRNKIVVAGESHAAIWSGKGRAEAVRIVEDIHVAPRGRGPLTG